MAATRAWPWTLIAAIATAMELQLPASRTFEFRILPRHSSMAATRAWPWTLIATAMELQLPARRTFPATSLTGSSFFFFRLCMCVLLQVHARI